MKSIVFLIGADEVPKSNAKQLATEIGFSEIKNYSNMIEIEQQSISYPVSFFLFEQISNVNIYKEVIESIRSCKRLKLRFSPLILLSDSPTPEFIRQSITIGFDDIISQPYQGSCIKERLAKQIDHSITYYETPKFFGPDRRRNTDNSLTTNINRRGVEKCRQFKFVRNLTNGISITKETIDAG